MRILRNGTVGPALLFVFSTLAICQPPGFVDTQVVSANAATGAEAPTAAAYEPGTANLYVLEKGSGGSTGQARVRVRTGGGVVTALILSCVDTRGERGLLGIAFSPDYLDPGGSSRFVYLFYTRRRTDSGQCHVSGQSEGTRFLVSRFVENGTVLSSETVILEGPVLNAATNHNGGTLRFASDETLFISTGDNDTDASSTPLSRDMGDLRGKLLRIHADGSIPGDNPFVGQAGVREEIWAYGLRNPFRFSYDDETETPYIGDVGEGAWEAIYAGVAGADFGYPCFEGSEPFRVCNPEPPPGTVSSPIYEYGHGNQTPPVSGASVIGGPVYRATSFPEEYRDNYFFGDFVDGWIRRARIAEDGRLVDIELFMNNAAGVVDMLVSPAGCLAWVGFFSAGVHETCFVGGSNGQPRAIATANTQSGQASLPVQFTGSQSDDPDGDTLLFAWDFGDGSSSLPDPSHTYTMNGVYNATLTVDDQQMESNSLDGAPPLRIVVGNRSPMPVIATPAPGSFYNAGDTLAVSGSATDPEDGTLADARFSWTVVFHHDTHVHPFLGPIDGVVANLTIPTTGEDSANVFYRIHLTVTDSGSPLGAIGEISATTSVDILPNVSEITLAAQPTGLGLELELDQKRELAPSAQDSVVSFPRTIGAPSPQTFGDDTYAFDTWSDAGAIEHVIMTPAVDTIFTATFRCTLKQLDNDTVDTERIIQGCDSITAGANYRIINGGDVRFRVRDSFVLDNGFGVEAGASFTVEITP